MEHEIIICKKRYNDRQYKLHFFADNIRDVLRFTDNIQIIYFDGDTESNFQRVVSRRELFYWIDDKGIKRDNDFDSFCNAIEIYANRAALKEALEELD